MRRHDAASVAEAFADICLRWGSPEVVCMDNGTEFSNAIVESLFQVFGTTVRTGAVRHPQSQGAAELFNCTLLTLIRKTLPNSADWKQDLKWLLFYYNTCPHGSTHLPLMEAMFRWQPRSFIVDSPDTDLLLSERIIRLSQRSAAIRDYIEEELSRRDFVSDPSENPYRPDDLVQVLRPRPPPEVLGAE